MIGSFFAKLFHRGNRMGHSALPGRVQRCDAQPEAIYAIGDVHGRIDLLAAMEEVIIDDASGLSGERWIVLLGDAVDRGPNSAQVLDHLVSDPPAGFSRVAIAGNHEIMMLDFLENPRGKSQWLKHGGLETLYSYGIREDRLSSVLRKRSKLLSVIEAHIPDEHVALLRNMPQAISFPNALMIHRKEDVRNFIRTDSVGSDEIKRNMDRIDSDEKWIVHGHTIVESPRKTGNRTICVDTGAYFTDRLSAVRISGDGTIKFLQSPTA